MTVHEFYPDEPPRPGDTPPQDLAAERSTIGSMLLTRSVIDDCLEATAGADFYRPAHEAIFAAIADMHTTGEPVDAITVADELTKRGDLARVGGSAYLHDLVSSVPTSASAAYYAQIVASKAVLRRLTEAGTKIAQLGHAQDGDVADIVEAARATVDAVTLRTHCAATHAQDVYAAIDALEADAGIRTPWGDLTDAIGGWRPGSLYYLGARPGVGKTLLGMCAALDVARRGRHALFCSLEMSRTELYHRMLSSVGSVDGERIMRRRLTADDYAKLAKAAAHIAAQPMTIDDRSGMRMVDVRSAARTISRRGPLGLVVVDYLQLMSSGRRVESRQVEVSDFSRQLKVLARELEVPVLALSQLNRGLESRADKRPTMSDLRESGSLEQDADAVLLLHRDPEKTPDALSVHVAKHRHGPSDMTVRLRWQGEYSRALDWLWSPSDAVKS